MIIKIKDKVRFREKDGSYQERVADRCIILGKKFKLEEKVSKNGNSFASLTLVEHNTYYHIVVFDKQLIDIIRNDLDKHEMIMALCDIQVTYNSYKQIDEEKYIMCEYMSNRKTILDPNTPELPKHTNTKDDDLDFDDNDFDINDESLPF